ncbi:homocysteine S-methyltransferase family protein [Vibrio paucivorans]
MKAVTILDGGMGRELKRMGAPFSQPLWSAQALIESPHFVTQAHQHFVDAGAQIIIANSYACVPFHLGDDLYQSDGKKLAAQAAQIARNVADNSDHKVVVAGAIPPAFGSYRPDLFQPQRGVEIFTDLFAAQDPFVDIWLAETISSLEELHAIHSVLQASSKDCYYAFSLEDTVSPQALLRSGEAVTSAIEGLCNTNAAGVMFNCSVPEVMAQAIKDSKAVMKQKGMALEIGVYANNFTPIGAEHEANDTMQSMRELSCEEFVDYASQWHQLGATVIGGCCGIGPEYIQALKDWKES